MSADRELDIMNDRIQSGSRFKELEIGPFNPLVPAQAGSALVKFFVPAGEIYNWYDSHIDLDLTFAATANYSNYLHMGRNMLIQSLTLQYDGNNYPININDCRIISSVMTLPQLERDEYMNRPQAQVAPTAAYMAGAARCELIQPIKKPSGGCGNLISCDAFFSAVAANAGLALGAAGTYCGISGGLQCFSTGTANAAGAVIALTSTGYPIYSIIAAGTAITVGLLTGYVGGYPFIPSATLGAGVNAAAGAISGYVGGYPVISTGTNVTLYANIGNVYIAGQTIPVLASATTLTAATNCGYTLTAISGSDTSYTQSPGGAALSIDQTTNGATVIPGASDGNDSVCTVIGAAGNAAGTTGQMCIKLRINLRDFKNTFFAINRTICWPRNANLAVTFAPTQYWGYSVPIATAAYSLAGATFLQSVVTVQNCLLRVSAEKDMALRKACTALTESGFSIRFPQVIANAYTLQSGIAGQYSINLDASMGQHILRIYVAAVRNDQAGPAWLNTSNSVNFNGTSSLVPNQYSTFLSWLGGEQQQDQALQVASCDDYRYLQKFLEGSAVTSQLNFSNFSFFVENFTAKTPSHTWDSMNCDEGGLPLYNEQGAAIQYNYRVQLNGTGALGTSQVYIIVVSQNMMTISPAGVTLGAGVAR